jgi:chromosomal replication initiator protein
VPEDFDATWEQIQDDLRREIGDFSFHVWIEPLAPAALADRVLYVRAPEHVRSWVGERYGELLNRAAAGGGLLRVELVDEAWESSVARAPAAPERPRIVGAFNPRYTFEQFVIGDGNRLAHAAALAVAEMPGQAYNPLFVCGPPGLGKTHLLHAIGNYVRRYGDGMTPRYATAETFTGEFVTAVRSREGGERFREWFRGADVLLLDDVQFLADKTKTREELFHTFNALYESGRQLVLTSDRYPSDLAEFEARLRERFASGLVADMAPPGLDLRVAILHKRCERGALNVSEVVLREIARLVTSSVRALEGALIKVVANASLAGEPPSVDIVRQSLGDQTIAQATISSMDAIKAATAEAFGVKLTEIDAHNRKPRVSFARQVAMYLARELTDESLPAIGRAFGGRNHATVLHAHRRINSSLHSDDLAVSNAVNSVQQLLPQSSADRDR